MKFVYIISLILILNFISSGFSFSQELKTGDLLFQIGGDSDFSSAITSSTATEDSLKFDHVAIIYIKTDSIMVLEASPKYGVHETSLIKFLEDSPKVNGKPGVIVKRLKCDYSVKKTIDRALSQIGKDYDWLYLPDNDKIYCSELVYLSFVNDDEQPIFKTNPMNFRNRDGSMPEFWTKLYRQLGTEVPEGIPGTNPNDMSKNEFLIEIYRYF